jgi:hypothetical protein
MPQKGVPAWLGIVRPSLFQTLTWELLEQPSLVVVEPEPAGGGVHGLCVEESLEVDFPQLVELPVLGSGPQHLEQGHLAALFGAHQLPQAAIPLRAPKLLHWGVPATTQQEIPAHAPLRGAAWAPSLD